MTESGRLASSGLSLRSFLPAGRARRAAILAGLALVALALWRAGLRADAIDYETAVVDEGVVERTISATGSVKALVMVDVGTQLSGLVAEMHAGFNDRVKAGDVLAVIDRAPYETRVTAAEAELAMARADLELKQATLVKAETQAEFAKRDSARAAGMEPAAAISKRDADQAHTQKRLTAADIVAARAQLQIAEATVAQKEAALAAAKIDLAHTLVRSPIDGVVVDRKMQVGQTVAAIYQTPILFQIAQNLSEIRIAAQVDEADIGAVRRGAAASFTAEAFPETVYSGVVEQVRLAAIKVSGVVTYAVMIEARNPGERLFPDMTATVRIVSDRKENVLRVPGDAFRFRPSGAKRGAARGDETMVWTLDAHGRLSERRVRIGLRGNGFTEIAGGAIKAGDRVVLRARRAHGGGE